MPAQIFFTSDTHFSHALVAGLRGFNSPDEHDEALVAAWNAVVKPSDVVWHLGDVALGTPARWAHYVQRLNGRKILVAGNHDACHPMHSTFTRRVMAYHVAGFDQVFSIASRKLHSRRVLLSHFPYTGEGERDMPDRHVQWRPRDLGAPVVHGHVHSPARVTTSPSGSLQVHVGWDAWARPVPLDDVAQLLVEHE